MMFHVHELSAAVQREGFDVEGRLHLRLIHDFLHEIERAPGLGLALGPRAFEVEQEIQVRDSAARRHGYGVDVRHRKLAGLEAVIQRVDGEAAVVFGAGKPLFGNVRHNPAIHDQGRAAVVPDMNSQYLHSTCRCSCLGPLRLNPNRPFLRLD